MEKQTVANPLGLLDYVTFPAVRALSCAKARA